MIFGPRVAAALLLVTMTVFPVVAGEANLDTLAAWMTGSFSSAAQAEADEGFHDIRLEMARIWRDRDDGVWLYVEQAVATSLDQPYRQRVYRLTGPRDGVFESEVYAIPEPLRFAGAWREERPLAGLTPDDLARRDGCTVYLRWSDGAFEGSTREDACSSTLRGASYATSAVRAFADRLESWDRGFDADGNQVWGAEKGGYVFRKEGTPHGRSR